MKYQAIEDVIPMFASRVHQSLDRGDLDSAFQALAELNKAVDATGDGHPKRIYFLKLQEAASLAANLSLGK